ncbi:MAG: MFS transporter [Promethearchaeota archaeon]
MEKKLNGNNDNTRKKFLLFQMIIIALIYGAAAIFGFYEFSLFNTYIEHVLKKEYIYISLMVSFSGIAGFVFFIVFGILSDNTRSRWGRRRPYLLFGGVIAGLAMYAYAFSPNYFWCFLIDVIIIGIASNAFYAAQRVLIPDIIEMEYRGRANGFTQIAGFLGSMIPVGLTLYVNEYYSLQTSSGTFITQEGYILSFAIGGFTMVLVSIIGFFFIKEKPVSELPPKKTFLEDLRKTLQYAELKEHKHFFRIIIAMFVFNVGIRIILPFIFNYLFDLGFPTIQLILIFSIIIPISLLVMYLLGKIVDKYGRKRFLTPLILISSIGFFTLPFITPNTTINFVLYLISFILVLVALMGLMVPLLTWQQDLLPEDERGKFAGILNFMDTISQIPGAFIGGLIADLYGVQYIFLLVPIFLIGSIPLFLRVKETMIVKNE